jgi:hypothetical protein
MAASSINDGDDRMDELSVSVWKVSDVGDARISLKRSSMLSALAVSSATTSDETNPPAAGTPKKVPMKASRCTPPVLGGEWKYHDQS